MYMHITPLGVCIEFCGLACDVIGICSANHGFMLSFVGYKMYSLMQTLGSLLILKIIPLIVISVKTAHLGNLFRALKQISWDTEF